jgi:hypothetical protein
MQAKVEKIVLTVLMWLSVGVLGWSAGVTLTWNASSSPDVAGYRVYDRCSPASALDFKSGFTDYTYVGKVTQWREDVEPGLFNYRCVTAISSNGLESEASNMIFIYFSPPPAEVTFANSLFWHE